MKNSNMMGCIVKILVLVGLIAIGLLVYVTCTGGSLSSFGCQKIDKTLPDAATAPYLIPTITHVYYAVKAFQHDDGSVTMINWYERIGDEWMLHPEMETIPPVFRPKIERR